MRTAPFCVALVALTAACGPTPEATTADRAEECAVTPAARRVLPMLAMHAYGSLRARAPEMGDITFVPAEKFLPEDGIHHSSFSIVRPAGCSAQTQATTKCRPCEGAECPSPPECAVEWCAGPNHDGMRAYWDVDGTYEYEAASPELAGVRIRFRDDPSMGFDRVIENGIATIALTSTEVMDVLVDGETLDASNEVTVSAEVRGSEVTRFSGQARFNHLLPGHGIRVGISHPPNVAVTVYVDEKPVGTAWTDAEFVDRIEWFGVCAG